MLSVLLWILFPVASLPTLSPHRSPPWVVESGCFLIRHCFPPHFASPLPVFPLYSHLLYGRSMRTVIDFIPVGYTRRLCRVILSYLLSKPYCPSFSDVHQPTLPDIPTALHNSVCPLVQLARTTYTLIPRQMRPQFPQYPTRFPRIFKAR